MQNNYIILGTLALLGTGLVIVSLFGLTNTEPETAAKPATYTNETFGLSFTYPEGTAGYVLEERDHDDETATLLKTITLTAHDDHARLVANPPIGGEGPAVIAISVFANPDKQFPLAWAMKYPEFSSHALKRSADQELVVGGANALVYEADGLYPAKHVIVAHGAYLYVLTGQYPTPDSPLRTDFDTVVQSITFLPPAAATGKIDITVACESALAYKTFPDGAAVDAFITTCQNGEHPEVIERYIHDLGMDSAAI